MVWKEFSRIFHSMEEMFPWCGKPHPATKWFEKIAGFFFLGHWIFLVGY
jgi:hypothetical protein